MKNTTRNILVILFPPIILLGCGSGSPKITDAGTSGSGGVTRGSGGLANTGGIGGSGGQAVVDASMMDTAASSGSGVLTNVTQIAVGNTFACGLIDNGTVDCWGAIAQPQGEGIVTYGPSPVRVPGLIGVEAIASAPSADFICALLRNESAIDGGVDGAVVNDSGVDGSVNGTGTVKCWGGNGDGQLGDGTFTDSATPVYVSNLTDVKSITVGSFEACAILESGVWCWGLDVTPAASIAGLNSPTPVLESSLQGAKTVLYVGAPLGLLPSTPCVLFNTGLVQCATNSSEPQAIPTTSPASAISGGPSGGDDFACELLTNGTVDCWGDDLLSNPTVGNGAGEQIIGIAGATQISANVGGTVIWALLSDGTVQAVSPYYGPLSDVSVVMPGITNVAPGFTSIAAGSEFVCGLLGNGTVECWGNSPPNEVGGVTSGIVVAGAGSNSIVVAPGSICPKLLATCNAMSTTGIAGVYRTNCLSSYNADATNEGACFDTLNSL